MGWKDQLTTGTDVGRSALEAALAPGEQLAGTLLATRRSGLSVRTLALGVTADRLILAPVSEKHQGEVTSIDRADIVHSSTKGLGMDWRKLAGSNVAKLTIESRTHGEIKLSLLGDDLPERLVKGGPSSGIRALQEFLSGAG